MSNLKKVVLKYLVPSQKQPTDRYEVMGLENTIGYKIGEVLNKHDVQQLICKPNLKVVVK